MKVKEIISITEKQWPVQQAEDFDNVGLLCGNPEREVSGILVCHDALEEVVDEAIEKGCNLIICFHPIIFSGLKSLTGRNYVERSVIKALENKIAIYAIHTALDNDLFGVNYRIGKELGLENMRILMPKQKQLSYLTVYVPAENANELEQAIFDAGAGHIGFYDQCRFKTEGEGSFRPLEGANPKIGNVATREYVEEAQLSFVFESYKKNKILAAMRAAHPYEEVAYQVYNLDNDNQYEGLGQYGELKEEMNAEAFLNLVKEKFALKVIRYSNMLDKKIKRVGVLGGSGASGIKAAIGAGCDIYLSGDFKYHDFFMAENSIILADIGHFESEQFVVQQLYEFFSEKFTKFAVLKTNIKTNPVNYFL
ncbi:Nif3-like dinuclear metal center hexameric protein [Elizabethkingia meningoseptica]|uniref:GTP cyclohydrolase 1 type 2 homolog n=1 Tax=Elizabethkingia meningoseptica TaxID=238 RepID=A0A1V3TY81_ELIME|nr:MULTISPECIES: Nif3-like dinuclear metal center hexameric protein [Elizabethkingia]AQX13205.1 Nif3-like dinuclear metal center hexameric protein [Elizabethkingia meningoseptica]EJK5328922.1 Nif3-like dinuclear metal center hexameric protein [Elizabethkingia meningoseptica]MBG0514829.1 Nif3-like dinuclear metal center hexameric protein [Elizabethkingia meningoseptica]MDE5433665.1 Nif3-like dinuclear metal center hexameric protein [Elizabethkingia meningoseptica]MDE5437817.1 Nif3-like dinuclea